MTRFELEQVAEFLKQHKKINSIFRVDDTVIMMEFSKQDRVYFDMKKGDSYIFLKDEFKVEKFWTAPFDIVLQKRFSNSFIKDIVVEKNNRILKFICEKSSKYKLQKTILQLEFTGRNTNAIMIDEDSIIVEALRHIDSSKSFREIKVGVRLEPIPARNFKPKDEEKIEDIETFLKQQWEKRDELKLKSLKLQKLSLLQKKIDKLQRLLEGIPDEKELEQQMQTLYTQASIITANIHNLQNYEKEVVLKDFEGNDTLIMIPKEAKTPQQASNLLFKKAKKLKQKIAHSHIERENLQNKIEFYQNMKNLIQNIKSSDELNLYFPKQKKQSKKKKQDSNIEVFYYKDYKIMVGKNQKGNQKLLKEAKMSDIWMHIKDIPSSHVIIRSNKQQLPQDVIEFGANLCVHLSSLESGNYLVDFTQRRNVKVREGANVHYVNYNTVGVKKE